MAEAVPQHSATQLPVEQKKEKGALENLVDEFWDFGKKAIAIGAVAASPFIFSAIDPSHLVNAQLFTYAVSTGHATANLMQNKPVTDGLIKRAATAQPVSYQLAKTFSGLNQLEAALAPDYGSVAAKTAKIGTWVFAAQPAVVTTDAILNYGLGKNFRKNLWPRVKDTFLYLALPSSINVGLLYTYGLPVQMAVSGILSFIYGLINAKRGGEASFKNLFSALNPFAYIGAAASSAYKLVKNTISGVYYTAYGAGNGVIHTLDYLGSQVSPAQAGHHPPASHSTPARPRRPAPSSHAPAAPAHH
ncbi:hypothetical protein HY637_05650 [Candidatus Woesearchaeota archaeon]|nr:hypothetical protein [Candidatus Woesearchaeota archaeon]